MKMIVSADKNWGIGSENELLLRIPEDMKRFRQKTIGNIIVMGRKTLESFPGGNPLKDRVNIVLTKNKDYSKEGTLICRSVSEVFEKLKEYSEKEVFIVGGGAVYNEFLPFCTTALVTKIDYSFKADTFIENLDENKEWKLESESEEHELNGIKYRYTEYIRKN